MNISMQYFMLVVEMQSISKAAERLFVTQQNLSNHIKRLEQQYGVLFTRKPKFMLTPSGEALYETLKQIRVLESNLQTRLQDIQDNSVGLVRLGLHTARARILLPSAAAAFQARYPRVRLEVLHADTAVYEKMLAEGDIDLFLGVDAKPHQEFSRLHLIDEPVFLLAAKTLLEQYGCPAHTSSITKKELRSLPLIFSPQSSNLQSKIQNFFLKNNIAATPQIVVGDFTLQLQMAREHLGACFCPQMFLADERVLLPPGGSPLQKYTVEGFSVHNRLDLVLNKRMYRPNYVDELIAILRETILNCFTVSLF